MSKRSTTNTTAIAPAAIPIDLGPERSGFRNESAREPNLRRFSPRNPTTATLLAQQQVEATGSDDDRDERQGEQYCDVTEQRDVPHASVGGAHEHDAVIQR